MAGKVKKSVYAGPGNTPAPASLDPKTMYIVIASGDSQYMKARKEYEVSGKLAETLIKKGYAKLKTE